MRISIHQPTQKNMLLARIRNTVGLCILTSVVLPQMLVAQYILSDPNNNDRRNDPLKAAAALPDSRISDVDELDLTDDNLDNIPPEVLRYKNLATINLGGNHLILTPDDIKLLEALPALKHLFISANKIDDAGFKRLAESKLQNIQSLSLNGNPINNLDFSAPIFSNLRHLTIGGNPNLKSLPDNISNLNHLEELQIVSSGVTALPATFSKLTTLQNLHIMFNPNLKFLPDNFSNLTSLRTMTALKNGFVKMDVRFPASLEELSLDACPSLHEFPVGLRNCRKLTSLTLNYDGLESIPAWIGELSNITMLSFRGNKIAQIPDAILQLKLKVLDPSDNPIDKPGAEVPAEIRLLIDRTQRGELR
jgi:Leucine-rich repeat (LRR) protein